MLEILKYVGKKTTIVERLSPRKKSEFTEHPGTS